jgi:hypothetical protein
MSVIRPWRASDRSRAYRSENSDRMRFPVQAAVLSCTGLPKANTLFGHNTLSIDRDRTGPYQGTLKFGKSEERVVVAIAKNAEGLPSAKVVWIVTLTPTPFGRMKRM